MANDLPASAAPEAPAAIDPAADPASWAPVEAPGPRCPWCSAALPIPDLANCPSCKAQLIGAGTELPGLTEVGPTALRPAPAEHVRKNRLLAWISGDVVDDASSVPSAVEAQAIAPPSLDVRREILRIELESIGIHVPADGSDTTAEGDPTDQAEVTVVADAAPASDDTALDPTDAVAPDAVASATAPDVVAHDAESTAA